MARALLLVTLLFALHRGAVASGQVSDASLDIQPPFTNTLATLRLSLKLSEGLADTKTFHLRLPSFQLDGTSENTETENCGGASFKAQVANSGLPDAMITFEVDGAALHAHQACTIITPTGMVTTPHTAQPSNPPDRTIKIDTWSIESIIATSTAITVNPNLGTHNQPAPPPPPPMPYLTVHTPFVDMDTKVTFAFLNPATRGLVIPGDTFRLQLPEFHLTHAAGAPTTQGCGTTTFHMNVGYSGQHEAQITFTVATANLAANTACTITTAEGQVKTPTHMVAANYKYAIHDGWTHIPAAQSTAIMMKMTPLSSSELKIDNPLAGAQSSFTFTFKQATHPLTASAILLLRLPLWEFSTAALGQVTSAGCARATIASIQNSGQADASITFRLQEALALDTSCSITTTAKLPSTSQPADLNTRTVQILDDCNMGAAPWVCTRASIPTAIQSSTGTSSVPSVMPGSKAPRASPGKCTQMAPDVHRVACPEAHGGFVWSCEREWASGTKAAWDCLSEKEAQEVLQRDI